MSKNKDKLSGYLGKIIVGFTIFALIVVWAELKNGLTKKETWTDLLEALVPELLAPLIAFSILYIIFFRNGIDIEALINNRRTKWLKKGYETFNEIEWNKYLESSRKLVIVAFYAEKWINNHSNGFETFMKNKNSRLIVYLPDYRDAELLKRLKELIPKYSEQQLKEKIVNTIFEVQKRTINKNPQDVSVHLYKRTFNYTLQSFDNVMFVSINELARETEYKSPFIQIDLAQSQNLQSFYEQEIVTLEKTSEKINLQSWDKTK